MKQYLIIDSDYQNSTQYNIFENDKIKISKWKIGEKYYIVLSFDNQNRLLNIASCYLKARGWLNVKQKNWNITLGLNNDLNKTQIDKIVNILKGKCVEWKWFAVFKSVNGCIKWDNLSYPVYQL
eukprot:147793_1